MNLYKKTLLKYWKNGQNKPIIAIISITSGHSSFNIVHNVLRNETFRMMGHTISSNNVKLIQIWFD